MKLKLLFIGQIIILISVQIGWGGNEARLSVVVPVRPIETASDVEQSPGSNKAADYSEVRDFSKENSGDLAHPNKEPHRWFIGEQGSEWSSDEWEMIHEALSGTFRILAGAEIDGKTLLSGYRFRRISGEYVDSEEGKIAIVNHEKEEIWLADAAFLRLEGFYIYHELGHAVDRRLERKLSQAYHARTGGKLVDRGNGDEWQSGDMFWMRPHGRDDREEATADAFALLVTMSESTSRTPIFSGMPTDVNYNGIADAVSQSLTGIATAGGELVNVGR
jgi:hypothetical protein